MFCRDHLADWDPGDEWLRDEWSEWASLERDAEIEIEPAQELAKRDVFEQKPRRPEHPDSEAERDEYPEQEASRKQQEERGNGRKRLSTCPESILSSPIRSELSSLL